MESKSPSTSTAEPSNVLMYRLRTGGENGFQTGLICEKIVRMLGYVNVSMAMSGVGNGDVIDLPMVDELTLARVIGWCTQHKDDEPLEEEELLKTRNKPISEWDKNFLGYLSNSDIFALTIGADFLHVPGLLDVCCKTIAGMLKGLSAEAIRAKFGINDDLTADEKQELQNEHQGLNRIMLS